MTKQDFIKRIFDKFNHEGSVEVTMKEDSVVIWHSKYTGGNFQISVNENNKPEFNFYFRTNSWFYSGERTDLHDTFSLTYSLWLTALEDASGLFFYVSNPATGADNEIYSTYYVPVQFNPKLNQLNENSLQLFEDLIFNFIVFEEAFWNLFGGCPCDECRTRLGLPIKYNPEIEIDLMTKINKSIGEAKEFNDNYCQRQLPTWSYYRNFKKKITIVNSTVLSNFLFNITSKCPLPLRRNRSKVE